MAGRSDAFGPVELPLASLAACILKGTERVIPMLDFGLSRIEVSLHGVRQDNPPKMVRIDYQIVVDTDESGGRIKLLHLGLSEICTIDNTRRSGTIRRKGWPPSLGDWMLSTGMLGRVHDAPVRRQRSALRRSCIA